jgi:hypothetical protein
MSSRQYNKHERGRILQHEFQVTFESFWVQKLHNPLVVGPQHRGVRGMHRVRALGVVSALGVHGMAGVILKAVAQHVQPSLLGRDEICSNHGTQARRGHRSGCPSLRRLPGTLPGLQGGRWWVSSPPRQRNSRWTHSKRDPAGGPAPAPGTRPPRRRSCL